MDKRQLRIEHTFYQNYNNWQTPAFVDSFQSRVNTFDILEYLDTLEIEVYSDREYTLANEMLETLCGTGKHKRSRI